MKKHTRRLMTALLAAVFLFSTAMMARQWFDGKRGASSYAQAEQLAGLTQTEPLAAQTQPETEPAPVTEPSAPEETAPPQELVWVPAPVVEDAYMEELARTDLAALQEINSQVLGWIRIPDTQINYPINQTTDNDYYLEHSWDGTPNTYGAIFLECRNSPDFSDFNTIIYGHNMGDGTMFGGLYRYAQGDYWKDHPYVYIVTAEGVFRCEIFSTYVASVESETYGLSFNQDQTRQAFIDHALAQSEIDTGIVPATTDRIITLSTCTGWGYESRRVIHARLEMIQVYK